MPIVKKIWGCGYKCGFLRTSKKSVASHETRCFGNPPRRACLTCKHFSIQSDTVYDGYENGQPIDHEEKVYCCAKKDGVLEKRTYDCKFWEQK